MRKQIKLFCDYCNSIFEKDLSEYKRNIKLGRNNFCSLSCSAKFYREKGKFLPKGTCLNCGGSEKDKCSPFRYYLKTAKQRKHESNLTCEYLHELWNEQQGKCFYTGLNIVLKEHTTTSKDLGIHQASLDRIDNSKGYVKGNVRFVCLPMNLAKGPNGDEYVYEFINAIKEA